MSLINQVLRDLEKRRAMGAETRALSAEVRAVPTRDGRGAMLVAGLLGAAAASAIILFAHSRYSKLPGQDIAVVSAAPAHKLVAAPASGEAPAIAGEPRARAVPVFQLSQELQLTQRATPVQPPASGRKPISGVSESLPQREFVKEPAQPREQEPRLARPVANVPKARTPVVVPDVEEVVIPEAPSPAPVQERTREPAATAARAVTAPSPAVAADLEQDPTPDARSSFPAKQRASEPTAYERAELEYRGAVARLRQGRLAEAEAGFRAALTQDRSHSAARQALIGLLVDAGRNADAEAVLRETLAVNPRQPRHAMLLARLELDRGDALAAARTLEAVRQYAGVDAEYFAFLAAVYQRLGRHREAAELYANALAVAPGNAVWMMGLGISLQALQRTEDARAAFSRAAGSKTLNPDLQAFVESRLRDLSLPNR